MLVLYLFFCPLPENKEHNGKIYLNVYEMFLYFNVGRAAMSSM